MTDLPPEAQILPGVLLVEELLQRLSTLHVTEQLLEALFPQPETPRGDLAGDLVVLQSMLVIVSKFK